MTEKLDYQARVIKEYGWDPIAPYPGAVVVGDPRAAAVAVLEGTLGLTEQADGTYQDATWIATVQPFYCLPRPVLAEGRIVGHEHTQMLVTYRRKEKGGPEAA